MLQLTTLGQIKIEGLCGTGPQSRLNVSLDTVTDPPYSTFQRKTLTVPHQPATALHHTTGIRPINVVENE